MRWKEWTVAEGWVLAGDAGINTVKLYNKNRDLLGDPRIFKTMFYYDSNQKPISFTK